MTVSHVDLGEPIERLIRLIGGLGDEEDYQLLAYVTLHDMVIVDTQLMLKEVLPGDLWNTLRKSLIIRGKKIRDNIATIEEKLQFLDVDQLHEEERHSRTVKEHEAERKSILERIEQSEKELEQERENISVEEYELKRKEFTDASREKQEESARRLKTIRSGHRERLKMLDAQRRELKEELNNFRSIPLQSKKNIWERKSKQNMPEPCSSACNAWNSSIHDELGLSKTCIRSLSLRKMSCDEILQAPQFTPKCFSCGAVFSTPPPRWLCPICLTKQESQNVWERREDNTRCRICLVAPINRFASHHCRHCGRLVCSLCCSNRAVLPLLGFEGPEKVCDRCYKSFESI